MINNYSHRGVSNITYELCNVIKEKEPNFDELWKEYCSTSESKSKIRMIANSDYFRPMAEDGFKKLYAHYQNIYFSTKNNTVSKESTVKKEVQSSSVKNYKSQILMSVPAEVKVLIETFAKKNNMHINNAYKVVYKEIENRTNKNLKNLADNYAKKMGVKNCSKPYYISKNNSMMEILRNIAEGN